MWMRASTGVLSVAFLAACASTGGQVASEPADVDPVGSYTLTTVIQGTPVDGQMRIRGEPGSYTGAAYTAMTGELTFSSVSVDGNQIYLTAETPDGTVDIQIMLDGDTFTGTWTLGADGGAVSGRRVSG